MEIFSDFIEFQHIKYFCSKCMCEFLVEIRNKNYNVEVKCPHCGNVIKNKVE